MKLFQKRILVKGKVQGVGFRYSTKLQAERIKDVHGWVRNLEDGDVEIFAEGPEVKVDDLIAWCYKGSTMSDVSQVVIMSSNPIDDFSVEKSFKVLK